MKDCAEIAWLTGLTRARVTQIVNLTLLVPVLNSDVNRRRARRPPTVGAGRPLEPIEDREHIVVPEILLSGGENFAFRVRGDSMSEDGIRDGDVVVVKRQATAENGQTVVAVVNGEGTIKQFYRHGDRVELRPANPLAKSTVLESGSVEIRGVVVGLIRKS